MDVTQILGAVVFAAGVVNANPDRGPDPVATAATVTVIQSGQAEQHWIPSTTSQDPVTQARYAYARAKRIEYLTSDRGRDYWREQVEIQRLNIPGEFRR
jgi:hypothetical protein